MCQCNGCQDKFTCQRNIWLPIFLRNIYAHEVQHLGDYFFDWGKGSSMVGKQGAQVIPSFIVFKLLLHKLLHAIHLLIIEVVSSHIEHQ